MQEELQLVQEVYNIVINFMVNYSFQLVGSVIILVVGFIVAGWVGRVLTRVQEQRNVDTTLAQFIASSVRALVIGLFVIIALSKLGISINPLIAAIGGLAVGASFALQGPVSNYGAGLMIILTRLYKVGDTITIQQCYGEVAEITLSTTTLITEDSEKIIIPNKQITGEIHRNSNANRVLEGCIGIAYSASPEHAIQIVRAAISTVKGLPADLLPQVGIAEFADSSINLDFRVWLPTNKFIEKQHEVNLAVFNALTAENISIPFPQREVRILQAS